VHGAQCDIANGGELLVRILARSWLPDRPGRGEIPYRLHSPLSVCHET
jgi:hypothetical protein